MVCEAVAVASIAVSASVGAARLSRDSCCVAVSPLRISAAAVAAVVAGLAFIDTGAVGIVASVAVNIADAAFSIPCIAGITNGAPVFLDSMLCVSPGVSNVAVNVAGLNVIVAGANVAVVAVGCRL